ncbi:hypothetical protein TREMEDRAFT_60791 [Tremella mesenterica DSM 1558]|uniref:uncharacterized protein n=1 Tax=Tremella mesenterica (strain ATCC 24925 / CBS 8224 / DSM 1558 / NBRC 9311 / NRRL Y-6157 / RJB 2259-6 / UBC 559-6) TaxID=578456 RepID=UPI0003F4A012|nr:uncharacterized protein TREMEDRAFT_60791 [Tremella mesenterica DSM 1558]EIW71868.1 hypothetical protein TREMEDRAFT_60791 [Tremella mesenterica DSM 1558]
MSELPASNRSVNGGEESDPRITRLIRVEAARSANGLLPHLSARENMLDEPSRFEDFCSCLEYLSTHHDERTIDMMSGCSVLAGSLCYLRPGTLDQKALEFTPCHIQEDRHHQTNGYVSIYLIPASRGEGSGTTWRTVLNMSGTQPESDPSGAAQT